MNRTWKKTVTTILAFALAAGGMMGGASYLNEVSAAEQPVAALREAGEPAEMAVDAGVYEANAGDTIKVKVRACDIKDSFNSVGGRLLVNTEAFSVLSVTPGDTDDPDNENTEIFQKTLTAQSMCSEHTEKIGFIYCELESLKEDTVFLTIELRVNDDAKDGCYTVPFYLRDSSVSMATKIVETEDTWDVFEVNPDYRGALITVGAGSDEIIEPEEPEEYNYDYDYEAFIHGRQCIIAGSSWPPDEKLLIPYIERLPENYCMIIAPHDISEKHIRQIRESLTSINPNKVYLIDTVGILSQLYQYARFVYIGGGFGVNIHNIQEPVTFGCPVVFGPKYKSFKEAVDLVSLGGAFSINGQEELNKTFDRLINDEAHYQQASEICKKYLKSQLGATDAILKEITSTFSF